MTRRTEPSAMSCEHVRQRLALYLDGALSPSEHAAMQSHLSACQTCHSGLSGVKAFEAQLREAFRDEAPPPALWPRIAADLRCQSADAQGVENRQRARFPSRRAAIAAALLAVGVALTVRRLATVGVGSAALSRVDFIPPAPPMTLRLVLIGGRLCYFFERRIASYMYRIDGRLVSLYIMSSKDIDSPSAGGGVTIGTHTAAVREVDAFAHVLWNEGSLYYSLVSNQPAARVVELAGALAAVTG